MNDQNVIYFLGPHGVRILKGADTSMAFDTSAYWKTPEQTEARAWVKIPGKRPSDAGALAYLTVDELDKLAERVAEAKVRARKQLLERVSNSAAHAKRVSKPGTHVSWLDPRTGERNDEIVVSPHSLDSGYRARIESQRRPGVEPVFTLNTKTGTIGWMPAHKLFLTPSN